MHNKPQHRNPSHLIKTGKLKQYVGSVPPLTQLKITAKLCVERVSPLTQRKMLKDQDVGIKDPPILQQIKIKEQDVGIRDPRILQQIQTDKQNVGIMDPLTLQINQNPINIYKRNNMIKKQDKIESLRQQNTSKITTHSRKAYPSISIFSRSRPINRLNFFIQNKQTSGLNASIWVSNRQLLNNTCMIYHSGTEEEDQNIQNQQLPEENQHHANLAIRSRLIHVIDPWKLIGADTLVTRDINAFWTSTQASKILERNIDNIMVITSKDRQLALDKQLEMELQENIIEIVLFCQLKWINP
ncbi:MAG: hypothetical protein EZS28_014011 [Streblomastix strix]|uniref:Uncharacterized protein n=1 Tax=Streblomastix strix TaxID=222440 RepID=A0A5J4W7D7_9EUKA|nr:MAG: hypothetical protein EZS28_014011 [Streblomastix strix]